VSKLLRSNFSRVFAATAVFSAVLAGDVDFHAPAGSRYPLIGTGGSVLPGGRLLRPLGTVIPTGPGPAALAVSRNGTVATADAGPERCGVTIVEPPGKGPWRQRHLWARTPHSRVPELADPDWRSVANGIAFDDSGKAIWVSEGDSGRIRELDLNTGDTRRVISLNAGDWRGSSTGDLVEDTARRLFYVVDRANSRVASIEIKTGRVVSSARVEGQPFAIALVPDGGTLYVTNSDSVCSIDVRDPLKPGTPACVRTGSPEAVTVARERVYVANANEDSITVLAAGDNRLIAEIPLEIPSLEKFRGVVPAGMAYDPVTKWLLVAESGINAVGVVDTEKNVLIGHLPAGWMPTQVAISGDRVYVTSALGRGTGPNTRLPLLEFGEAPTLFRGALTTFIVPDEHEVLKQTGTTFVNDGFVPWMHDPPKFPAAIRHVVLIVKGGRAFDEIFGDVMETGSGTVQSMAKFARFGMHGLALGNKTRFSIKDAAVTPNHHAAAEKWAFSDNFHVDGNNEAEGGLWLNGGYPNLLTATGVTGAKPVDGAFWHHMDSAGVTFQRYDETGNVPDRERANRFIADLEGHYRRSAESLPGLLYLRLPGDSPRDPAPSGLYPYEASWVEDNDLALGSVLEYLSRSPWWPTMAVFVTESNTEDAFDHVDSHRTVLLAAGPYVKRRYVSHTNSSFPGLLRTIFELLHLPPLNLYDATASSLSDMFTGTSDLTPYTALAPDRRIFDPGAAK
jgi:DNA-binding beta-propeller fold protein YncE